MSDDMGRDDDLGAEQLRNELRQAIQRADFAIGEARDLRQRIAELERERDEWARKHTVVAEANARLFTDYDRALAHIAKLERHDCERWSMEGVGCAECNPSAIELRELWAKDPVRMMRDRALAAARELRADIGNAGTMVAKLYEKATASPTHSITLAAELLFVLLKDLHGVLPRTAWLDAPEEPLARGRTE